MKATGLLVTKVVIIASAVMLSLLAVALKAQDPADKSPEPVYELGEGVTAPKGVSMPNPEYTDKARKKKINGTVLLAMVVTSEGRVRDVTVIKSLDEELDKQAIAAVKTWKFESATKDGRPVAVHLKSEVTFRVY